MFSLCLVSRLFVVFPGFWGVSGVFCFWLFTVSVWGPFWLVLFLAFKKIGFVCWLCGVGWGWCGVGFFVFWGWFWWFGAVLGWFGVFWCCLVPLFCMGLVCFSRRGE